MLLVTSIVIVMDLVQLTISQKNLVKGGSHLRWTSCAMHPQAWDSYFQHVKDTSQDWDRENLFFRRVLESYAFKCFEYLASM